MMERPIIFSGEMVRAILDGRKTQTRRVMKPKMSAFHDLQYVDQLPDGTWMGATVPPGQWIQKFGVNYCRDGINCPYGQPGDLLWVRETWACDQFENIDGWNSGFRRETLVYRADNHEPVYIWRPSIHMPKWAARLWLKITDVRVERVQDISEEDALAEGVGHFGCDTIEWFRDLWDSINAKRGYSWEVNPWVWILEFTKTEAPNA